MNKFKAGDRVDIVLLPKAIPIGQHLYVGRSGEIFRTDASGIHEVRLDNGLIVPAGEQYLKKSKKVSKKSSETEPNPDVKTRSQYRHMTKGFLIDTIFELTSELQSKKDQIDLWAEGDRESRDKIKRMEEQHASDMAELKSTILSTQDSARRQAAEDTDVVNRCELMKILGDCTDETIARPGFVPMSWEYIKVRIFNAINTENSVRNLGETLAEGMKAFKDRRKE